MLSRLQPADIRLLRVFRQVVIDGGFSAAATTLNVGQSTISTHVKDLEERLGYSLCLRGRSGFELTEEGRNIFNAIEILEQQMAEFVVRHAEITKEILGTIRIGVVHVLSRQNFLGGLHELISTMAARHTQVKIEIQTERQQDLDLGIDRGVYDLACMGTHVKKKELNSIDLFNLKSHLYCSKRHLMFEIDDSDIDEETLALQKSVVHQYEIMKQTPFEAQGSLLTSSSEESIFYILSGEYIGYLTDAVAHSWLERGDLKMIKPQKYYFNSPGGIVYRKSSLSNPLVREAIEILESLDYELE